jgi:serine/threonine-protein kinase
MPLGELAGFVALSRDGSKLIYTTAGGPKGFYLALRPIDRLDSEAIPGTDDGRFPVFSPDGQSVAFSTAAQAIKRASLTGGGVVELCQGDLGNGGAWGDDNTIVFSGPEGLLRVSATGGVPAPLTKIDGGKSERAHVRPQFLAGGRQLLFTITKTAAGGDREFAVLDLTTGTRRTIVKGGDNGRFLSTGPEAGRGHLTYARDETLMAIPFDLTAMTPTGPEVPVIDGVSSTGPDGTADYTVSDGGLLVYSLALGAADRMLTWIDRSGKTIETIETPAGFGAQSRLSPDGLRVAGTLVTPQRTDIGILDIRRGTAIRLTHEGGNRAPVWMPDGSRVVFGATIDGQSGIFMAPIDGAARPRRLFPTAGTSVPVSVTPDGRTVLFFEGSRLFLGSTEPGQEKPVIRPLHDSLPGRQIGAQVSPDGRWVAYLSDDSGQFEAYVHAFPGPGPRERVSTDGARFVRWTSGGRELVYWNTGQSGNFAVTSVEVKTAPALQLGAPRQLFVKSGSEILDVLSDGSRFVSSSLNARSPVMFVTVTDWFEELRRRAPAVP